MRIYKRIGRSKSTSSSREENSWDRWFYMCRMTMWRISLFFCLLLIVASPTFARNDVKVCNTHRCKLTARFIKSAMNDTVDPCDNFYSYACGSWAAHHPVPPVRRNGKNVWDIDKIIENNINSLVLEMLEEGENSDDVKALQYEKIFHKSCLDTVKLEKIGIEPLEETVNDFGGWPITMNSSDWDDENHDWQRIHEVYSTLNGLSSIFDVFVDSDQRNESTWAIELRKPRETLYDFLLNKVDEATATEKYTEFVTNVVRVFLQSKNKTLSEDDISNDAEDIVNFEKSLRSLKISDNETSDMEPSPRTYMTIKELQSFYDEENPRKPTSRINWLQTIKASFKNVDKAENIVISQLEEIGVEDQYFLHKLLHLLEETPNRVIVNYVHWKFVSTSIKFTNKQMRDLHWQLITTGEDYKLVPKSRRQTCRADMKINAGLRYEFVKRYIPAVERNIALDMSSEMRRELLDEVERSTWLDDETKEETLMKLHDLKWRIARVTREWVEHVYEDLTIGNSYFQNVQNVRKLFATRVFKRLRKSRAIRHVPFVYPLRVRPVYDPMRRSVILSAAELFSPLFHSTLPLPVNYGYLAPTIGNLMARAMEKEVDTNIYLPPWSSYFEEHYKSYEPKTECFDRQYSNYSVGPATMDENMYDTIAIKVAYNAFRDSFINENIMTLPGLENLSEDQLFFVSYALEKCQTATAQYKAEHEPAYYTPNEYRVIGPLSNSQDFAKAFNCPVNSPMNPETKCTLL